VTERNCLLSFVFLGWWGAGGYWTAKWRHKLSSLHGGCSDDGRRLGFMPCRMLFFSMFRRSVLPRSLGWLHWLRWITHSCALKMAALHYFETSEQTKNVIRFKNPKDEKHKTMTYAAWNWRVRLSFQSRFIVMGVPKGIKRRALIIQDITYTAAPNNWI